MPKAMSLKPQRVYSGQRLPHIIRDPNDQNLSTKLSSKVSGFSKLTSKACSSTKRKLLPKEDQGCIKVKKLKKHYVQNSQITGELFKKLSN